jgi:hypothetical protein
VLIVEKEDGSAGGRDEVKKGEESCVGWLAEPGGWGQGFGRSGVEGLPAAGSFEVGEGNARGDTKRPGPEDRGLAEERKLVEDLD